MTFWLIEKVNKETGSCLLEPKYWAAGASDPARSSAWTGNLFEAIRFARQKDAENCIHRMMSEVSARAIEHMIIEEPQP